MKSSTRLAGEFILIIVGVLIALMIEAAFEERENANLGDEYKDRLRDDLMLDKLAIERRIEFFTDVKRFSEETLEWLNSDREVDSDILLAAYYAAEVWPFLPVRSTYEDLQNTGNIRLLDDIDLRTSLSGYYNKANISISGWTPSENYRVVIRGVIPNDVQALIRENCPTTLDLDQAPSGFPPCDLPGIDYSRMAQFFAPLRDNSELRRILTYRNSELDVMIYLLGQQGTFADRVLGFLPAVSQ